MEPSTTAPVEHGDRLLVLSSVETFYQDRIRALRGVSLQVAQGEVLAILGPNGAGKTTLLKTIAGLLRNQPRKGTISFDGRQIERRPPEEIARRGIVYVPEDRGLFRELTVAENLDLALWGRRGEEARSDLEGVYRLFPVLRERAAHHAETLSGGQQQMLAIGRALLRRPRLLMLDEPSLGLTPQMSAVVFDALRAISAAGTTILLVEQNAGVAFKTAHRAAILEAGRVVLAGAPRELAHDPDVRHAYLGLVRSEATSGSRVTCRRRRW